MGKKKIATAPTSENPEINSRVGVPTQESVGIEKKISAKRRVDSGVLYVESTYNNTKLTLKAILSHGLQAVALDSEELRKAHPLPPPR